MKIVADINIPIVKDVFSGFGEVELIHGRKITNDKIKNARILLVRSVTKVNKKLLNNTKIKFVATATIGEDHIDKTYLKKNNIGYSSAPGSNADSVAEYIITALFELTREKKINLNNLTLGIIGVGNVGSRVKKRAEALSINYLLNDPPKKRETNDKKYIPLDEVLKKSDIITVHVPLNKEGQDPTYNLINENFLNRMKKGSILINSSRGKVMIEKAIKKYRNKLNGLILDVWEDEPQINTDTLKTTDIATPHIAGYSYDGKICGTKMIYKAACTFFSKHPTFDFTDSLKPKKKLIIDLKNSNNILYDAITKAYPIKRDNNNLRKIINYKKEEQGKYFDSLRKKYPIRREFNNYSIICKNNTKETSILKNLGFKIKFS